ncbi:unnamed protein product [Polarella glacialis]|uniref:Uncharacterized protein n=1 Tax=Polarella glacialis TaxID=89957 RepID=A0A813FCA3_POLGL|nr:unnamed protein product [Polarella glacialis]
MVGKLLNIIVLGHAVNLAILATLRAPTLQAPTWILTDQIAQCEYSAMAEVMQYPANHSAGESLPLPEPCVLPSVTGFVPFTSRRFQQNLAYIVPELMQQMIVTGHVNRAADPGHK